MSAARHTMTWVAGAALIAAALLNVLAVLGRHTGLPLKGAIEIIQLAVLIAGSLALIAATLAHSHARVHLLLDRLSGAPRDWAERVCTALTMLLYLLLLAGSVWLAIDLWDAQEVSELVGVPWRFMRLFLNLSLVVILVLLARQLVERREP